MSSRAPIDPTRTVAAPPEGGRVACITVGQKYAIGLGLTTGAKVLSVTGRRLIVSTEAEAWPGVAARPARSDTPGAITVVSTSAADAQAGAGARTLVLEYLDDTGYERVALAALAGLTPVTAYQAVSSGVGNASTITLLPGPVAASGRRVNRAYVVSTGSPVISGSNAGILRVRIAGTEILAVQVGANISWSSWVTVPLGQVGLVAGFGYSTDRDQAGRVSPYVRRAGYPYFRLTEFEASSGALATPTTEYVRVAPLGEYGITFTKDASGQDLDVASLIQAALYPDSAAPDPRPDLQPPPFG